MATIARYRTVWSGFPGAPGYTSLYSRNTAGAPVLSAIRTFWSSVSKYFPTGTTLQVEGTQDLIEETTGALTGQSINTPPAIVTSIGSGGYTGVAGAVVDWSTISFVNSRRVRGRTFLVPLINSAFDTSGSLLSTAQTDLQTAVSTLVSSISPDFVVWHRPVGGTGGQGYSVTSGSVPDFSAVLRSRRT